MPIATLLTARLPDNNRSYSDSEFQRGAAASGASANYFLTQARTLASLQPWISILDFAGPQDVGVKVAIKSSGQLDVKFSGCELNVEAAAAPTARSDLKIDGAGGNRGIKRAAGEYERRICLGSCQ